MASPKPTAQKYKVGTNERLDALIGDDEEVWCVNGSKGRIPVAMPLGSTKEQALARYAERFATKPDMVA